MNVSKEKIRVELERMGYSAISDEQLDYFKKDLDQLLTEELKRFGNPLSPAFEDAVSFQPSPIIIHSDRHLEADSNSNRNEQANENANKQRIIKRKTLRYLNGKAYVSEESLISPTSVICLNDHQYSDDSFEDERRSSTPDSERLADCFSLPEPALSTTKEKIGFLGHSRLPIMGYGTRHCDPVLRYHQYKRYWDAYKPPGEKSHKELRRFIRDQILDNDPTVISKRRPSAR